MSVTIGKADGVTVLTLTSDPKSSCPPLCQILKGLCYSASCYVIPPHMRKFQTKSLSVLGTLQIMIGLMNIGLGILLCMTRGLSWEIESSLFPFWLAAIFILFGILCIVSENYPSPCLVGLTVALNITGIGFSIAAIVLYSLNLAQVYGWWICEDDDYSWYDRITTPAPSHQEDRMKEKCLIAKKIVLVLVRGIHGVLIVLSVMQLCVSISSVVLGIRTLRRKDMSTKPEVANEPEMYNPLLEEGGATPTA